MEYKSSAVSPTESISQGWNIIKDNYWLFFGMNFVFFLIIFIVSIVLGLINNGITFGISAVLGIATQGSGDIGQGAATVAPQFISTFISLFTNIIVVTCSGILFCGIYKALARTVSGEKPDFGDLFSGFDKVMPCFIFAIAMSAVQFIIAVIILGIGLAIGISAIGTGMVTADGQLNPAIFGGLLVFFLVVLLFSLIANLIIGVLTSFVYPLISNSEMSGGKALMLSARSGFSNFIGLTFLLVLLGLMAFGGALVCFVGVLFVVPIISASIFAAFQSVFGGIQDNRQHTPPAPPQFGEQINY